MTLYKYHQALLKVGSEGLYQKIVAFFTFILWIFITQLIIIPTYIYSFPQFQCHGIVQLQNQSFACTHLDICKIKNINSLTSHLNLICQKSSTRDLIIGSQLIGSFTGLLIIGYMSDKFGRKLALLISIFFILVSIIFTLIGGHFNIITFLFMGQIFRGFGVYPLQMITYFMIIQISSEKFSTKTIVFMYCFWGLSQVLYYPILSIIPRWNDLLLYGEFIPILFVLLLILKIKETPKFLLLKSSNECKKILNEIGKINKKQLLLQEDEIIDDQQEEQKVAVQYFDLFKQKKNVKKIILFSIILTTINIIYDGLTYSLSLLQLDYKTNILIVGILEFIGYFAISFVAHKLKRKKYMIITLSIMIILLISYQFFELNSSNYFVYIYIQTIFAAIIKFLSTIFYTLITLILTQSFANQYRASCCGFIQSISMGSVFVPFLISFNLKIHINQMCFIGLISIIGLISLLFIEETLKYEQKYQRRSFNINQSLINQS